MKARCDDKIRCYPQGECPLKDKCLWRGVPHKDETCAETDVFDITEKEGVKR